MTELTELTFASNGAKLWGGFVHATGAPRDATVVLCHGLTNHHDDAPMFGLLRDGLLAAGYDVFLFDFYGSGQSDGTFRDKTWTGMRQNLADALDTLHEELPVSAGRVALVGRSVGASVAGYFLKDERIACSVLASPVLLLETQFGPYRSDPDGGYVRMPEYVERSGQIKGDWVMNEQFFDELVPAEHELIEAVTGASRVLVMHGHGDPKVKTVHSERLMQLLADPKMYIGVDEGDHYYTGHEDEAGSATLDWLNRYLSPAGGAS